MTTNRIVIVACLLVFGQLLLPAIGIVGGESTKPDLALTADDIVFSKNKPLKGDTVQINATVHNYGGVNASNVRVTFYDGVPANNKTISSDQILEAVPSNGSAVARVNWTDTSVNGTHYIYVVVDRTDAISEDNENNNTANRSILVNLAPTAKASADMLQADTLTEFNFKSENSSDPDGWISTSFWDFDDGNTTKGADVKHAWGDDGVYNVTLLVTDNDGGTDTDMVTVTVLNRKPDAVAYDQSAYTLDTVTLDCGESSDDDGYVASAKWTLHNGTVLNGKKVTTSYLQNDIYAVSLTVTDDDGDTDSTELYVTVKNRDPVAKINASSNHVNISESIAFDAYKSYDLDGYITNYTWIFAGGAKEYGVQTSHMYGPENGTFKVTLAVVDDDGAIASAIMNVRVGNLGPVAIIGGDAVAYTYENITFDASKCYDPDGKISDYSWDFGDGALSSDQIEFHYYTNNGKYNVTLLVTDDDGATARARMNVTVLNQPPMAFYPDTTAKTFQNITLNGSLCYDNDGYIVNFTWDLGTERLFGPEVDHNWARKGVYEITLEIKDDDGGTDSWTFNVTIDNTPPRALFLYSPTTITEQQKVTFNAAGSSDLDGFITSYNWNFGDGVFGTGATADHIYSANGSYRVMLIVTDNDGGTDTAIQNISVSKYNPPPVADFTFSPLNPTSTDYIDFDASASYDPAAGTIKRYEWDWGDGNSSQLSLPRTSHRFYAPGDYEVTLTVVDDAALRTSITKPVTVAPGVNHPPVALIRAERLTQESGKPLAFDGSTSYDDDGAVVNYTWDFGDGSRAYFPMVNHIFTLAQSVQREFTVTLTVTDDQGLPNSTSVTVTITPAVPPNLKPKAVLSANPTPLYTNAPVHLSASGSADPDGTIPSDGYSWSFGDGNLGSGIDIYHSYAKPGIYVVLLTVKDDRGATGSATETIYVLNQAPKPKSPGDLETNTLDPVQLSGAGSSDSDGEIVGYSWDFGDGTQDSEATVTHIYYHSGVYLVRLTVVDDYGKASSATLNITVRNRLPVAALEGVNASGYAGDPLSFDASRSSDADGRIVNYSWDFGDGYLGAGPVLKHSFNMSGIFNVRLTVTDDSGGASVTNMTVTIIKKPTIKPPTPAPAKGFIPGFEILVVATVFVVVALAASRKRK